MTGALAVEVDVGAIVGILAVAVGALAVVVKALPKFLGATVFRKTALAVLKVIVETAKRIETKVDEVPTRGCAWEDGRMPQQFITYCEKMIAEMEVRRLRDGHRR